MTKDLPWFRLYSKMVDNEKIRLLAFEDRWHFTAILCCKSQGILEGSLVDRKLSVKLGLQLRELDEVKRRLMEVELIDENWQPIGWDKKQFSSDSSTERVRKYREKHSGNVTETFQKRKCNVIDTDTDTDTEEDTEKEESVASAPQPLSSQKKKVMYSDEDMALAVTMHYNITQLTGSKKKVDLEKWANEFRLMREIDRRDVAKMDNFLHMLATNEENMWQFWRGNILSPASMRKNYDKVVAQYRRDVVDAGKSANPNIPLSERVSALSRVKKEITA